MHLLFTCVAWNHFRTATGIRSMEFFAARDVSVLFREPSKNDLIKVYRFLDETIKERQAYLKTC